MDEMRLDESHVMNQLVLKHLRDQMRLRFSSKSIVPPDKHSNPYMDAGSHPEIVERVWDALGSSLPVDCRAIVYGAPALVHPVEGVIIALAYGTMYAVRIPDTSIQEALGVGCKLEQEWTGGGKTYIEKELGHGWVFGNWASEEEQWLAMLYADMGVTT